MDMLLGRRCLQSLRGKLTEGRRETSRKWDPKNPNVFSVCFAALHLTPLLGKQTGKRKKHRQSNSLQRPGGEQPNTPHRAWQIIPAALQVFRRLLPKSCTMIFVSRHTPHQPTVSKSESVSDSGFMKGRLKDFLGNEREPRPAFGLYLTTALFSIFCSHPTPLLFFPSGLVNDKMSFISLPL